MSESNSTGSLVLAALGGAVVGAGLALLYAPQPGRKTRRDIMDMGEDAAGQARSLYGRAGRLAGGKKRQLSHAAKKHAAAH